MSDIVEQFRNKLHVVSQSEQLEAANTIESLRAQVETLKQEIGKLEVTLELRLDQVYHSEKELVILKEQIALFTQAADSVAVQEPVAWAILAKNGKVRIWWNNKESAMARVSSNGNDYDQLEDGERFIELYANPASTTLDNEAK